MDTIFDVAMIGEYPNQNLGLAGLDLITNISDYDRALLGDPMDSIPDLWMTGRLRLSQPIAKPQRRYLEIQQSMMSAEYQRPINRSLSRITVGFTFVTNIIRAKQKV